MSLIDCGRCGGKTNTALCDWVDCIETGKASRCYARWDEEKKCWVEGCAIADEDADKFMVNYAKKTIEVSSKEVKCTCKKTCSYVCKGGCGCEKCKQAGLE